MASKNKHCNRNPFAGIVLLTRQKTVSPGAAYGTPRQDVNIFEGISLFSIFGKFVPEQNVVAQ